MHPRLFRLGARCDWDARWYAESHAFAAHLAQDMMLRRLVSENLAKVPMGPMAVHRSCKGCAIHLRCPRLSLAQGRLTGEVDAARGIVRARCGEGIDVVVEDIRRPELCAHVIARGVVEQIERRAHIKRAIRRATGAAVRQGARGVKVMCSGRLNGAEIARVEWHMEGTVPLHSIGAEVDYAAATAKTVYGIVGVKVWVHTAAPCHERTRIAKEGRSAAAR
ncbi:30S ribosomal protein S3 [Candidatus Tremblaya princeps]|uniref:Small ribosomal subunit protein uS3 n=1 Tax=Tremblaya princeps TaxID=189385 RepID=A0A143WNL7_TREPR|nr:30S ribosomal protein S3 [Candidatus Tremblaya princeps]